MFVNATITVTRGETSINQTTGRRESTTPETILQDAPCLVGQSKSRRVVRQDGLREFVKPAYSVSIETYDDITLLPGDQAEITMHDAETTETYTIDDAILSVGIRRRIWKCDIERIKTP